MAFVLIKAAQMKAPDLVVLPDSRKRITRFFNIGQLREIPPELDLPWGTLDTGDAPEGWTGLRLTKKEFSDEARVSSLFDGEDKRPMVTLTYEQIDEKLETQVGGITYKELEDGRNAKILNWVQFSTGTRVTQAAGSTTGDGYYLMTEEAPDDGTLRQITRTYVQAGILATGHEIKNNGALEIRTIKSAVTVPATPSGFVLIGEPVQSPVGYPVYDYTFAKGNGEVSRRTEYRLSENTGTTGVTIISVKYLSASTVTTTPIATPAGFVVTENSHEDADGYRIWTGVFAAGIGLVETQIHTRQDGLREETYVFLGVKGTTVGIVIRDEMREADGYTIFTVTCMQAADGINDPTVGSTAFDRYVQFTYPGRAKVFIGTFNSKSMLDVFLSPPITTEVMATVNISYTTLNTLGTIINYWNPKEWACYRAQWVGFGNSASNMVKALPGYRSVSGTPVTVTSGTLHPDTDASCLGNTLFGGTTAVITCTGGPADPTLGGPLVLDATIEPAFTATNGTQYYRKTLVTATIPTQAALPV